jgi:hypothetical protein
MEGRRTPSALSALSCEEINCLLLPGFERQSLDRLSPSQFAMPTELLLLLPQQLG